MLSLNQSIAKWIHNKQYDNRGDVSAKGIVEGFGLKVLDGVMDGIIIVGTVEVAIATAEILAKRFKKRKG